ncbi:MAG: esterase/lipase family protein [Acidiferrobacterales bacterium]
MKKLVIVATVLSFILAGCGTVTGKPDLNRLYAVSSSQRAQHPVILIPGAGASRLRRHTDGREIWPGPLTNFLFKTSDRLALEIDPETLQPRNDNIEAYGLFDGVAGVHYYRRIRSALESAGGYSLGKPGQRYTRDDRRYYIFLYDWRQNIPETAAQLDRLVEQIRSDYADPSLKVDIIAHSMGGLLARYFIRYGSEDVLDSDTFHPNGVGAAKIGKVILIGTPNWGSIKGLQVFMKGKRFGLMRLYPEILATMPAAYELLPHPDRDWMIALDGSKWDRDLYSVKTWRDNQWSIFAPEAQARIRSRFDSSNDAQRYIDVLTRYFERNLLRAKHFHRALSVPPGQAPVRYVVFGGDCTLTPARCLVEPAKGRMRVRFHPRDVVNRVPGLNYDSLMLEPGDGTVTKPSLLARNSLDPSLPGNDHTEFPIAYSVFLCERHAQLTANLTFQDNLLNILLSQATTQDRVHTQTIPVPPR